MKNKNNHVFNSNNHRQGFVGYGLITILFLLLASCGGGGGSSSSGGSGFSTVTVSGSLGQFRNAEVRLFDGDLLQIGEPVELDANGIARFDRPPGAGPFLFEISGDADAEYYDESTQQYESFLPGQTLRAIIGSVQREVGVTLFTDIAVEQLENETGGIPSATVGRVDAVNESIRQIFLDGLDDITLPPTIVGSSSDSLGEDLDDMYAAMLAAYAELASGEPTPAIAMLNQLREDLSDGVFDSRQGMNPLVMEVVDLSDLPSSLDVVFADVVSKYGNSELDISDLQVIRDGELNGLWTVSFSGFVDFLNQRELIPLEIIDFNITADEVPSFRNDNLESLEDELIADFVEGFTQGFPGSVLNSFSFNIRSESLSTVVVDFGGAITVPGQFVSGTFIPTSVLRFELDLFFDRNE